MVTLTVTDSRLRFKIWMKGWGGGHVPEPAYRSTLHMMQFDLQAITRRRADNRDRAGHGVGTPESLEYLVQVSIHGVGRGYGTAMGVLSFDDDSLTRCQLGDRRDGPIEEEACLLSG